MQELLDSISVRLVHIITNVCEKDPLERECKLMLFLDTHNILSDEDPIKLVVEEEKEYIEVRMIIRVSDSIIANILADFMKEWTPLGSLSEGDYYSWVLRSTL
jgi:hypothetical protein